MATDPTPAPAPSPTPGANPAAGTGNPMPPPGATLDQIKAFLTGMGVKVGSPTWTTIFLKPGEEYQRLQLIYGGGTGGGGTSSDSDPGTFPGSNYKLLYNGKVVTVRDVYLDFHSLSDRLMKGKAYMLYQAGLISSPDVPQDEIWKAYLRVAQMAADKYAGVNGNNAPDFGSILRGMIGDVSQGGGPKAPEKTLPDKYSLTNANISDPRTADDAVTAAMQKMLGRDPTGSEKAAFVAALNAAQRKTPTTETYTKDPTTGLYNTSTSGGVDPNSFASEYTNTHNEAEYNGYQAATTYMDALYSALGPATGGQ